MDMYKAVMLIFAIIFIVIQCLIINYLAKLESIGCECAMDWRRHYIVFFMIISVVYAAVISFVQKESMPLIQTMMFVIGLLNVVFTLQYVNKLKKEKCKCSESVYRDVMMFVSIFNAILYSLFLTLMVYYIFSMASYMKTVRPAQNNKVSIRPLKRRTRA